MDFEPTPFTPAELWEAAHASQGFSKHLLSIYSMAVGLDAQVILDLGIGSTTRALRAAARVTGGKVISCDCDRERYAPLLAHQDDRWQLVLSGTDAFLSAVDAPVDFVVHDSAHDYFQVRQDLELILPRMRTFGLVCVHDTQQPELQADMVAAIRDVTQGWAISMTNLPFACGLAIIRVERGNHPPRPTRSTMPDGASPDTAPLAMPMRPVGGVGADGADRSLRRFVRWRLRKIVKGF